MMMMYPMKRIVAFLAVLVLYLPCGASAEDKTFFDEGFRAAFNLTSEDAFGGSRYTTLCDTVYRGTQDGDIYAWDPQSGKYAFYARLPKEAIFNFEVPLARQSEETKMEIAETVTNLVTSADEIYGFNAYTGAIGTIDEEGIHWSGVRLEVDFLRPYGTDYPWMFQNAFIEDGKLYGYHDLNMIRYKKPNPELLIYDLSTGGCTHVPILQTIDFCSYTPGKLLCIQDNGSETPSLAVYELATEQLTDLSVTVPISIARKFFAKAGMIQKQIGALAYDTERDTIYLADPKGLWRSIAGAPFERMPSVSDWSWLDGYAEIRVLASGGYVQGAEYFHYVEP